MDDFRGLKVSGLSKRCGNYQALENVGFELRPGEILGLIGPNAAGKTTLFECLAGVLPKNGGLVQIGDRQIEASERATLLFYLPDGIAPWPAQSVRWVLDFTVHTLGVDPQSGRGTPNPDLFPVNNPVLRPPVAGKVGLWSKTDSTSYFKDYVVETQPETKR